MIQAPQKTKDSKELRLGANSKYTLDGGLCLDQESSIALSQSPYLLNMCLDDGGLPTTRQGQTNLFTTSLGPGPINGVYPDYKGYKVLAHGTKLYKQLGSNKEIEIYSGLTNSKTFLFVYNSILYIKNSNQFLKYDGNTVTNITAYEPVLFINGNPDGYAGTNSGKQAYESFNLLNGVFWEHFNGDGTNKTFTLSANQLDAMTVTATVNGTSITEGSGLTVDRTTGKITFTTAPSAAGTLNPNNVKIRASKTVAGAKEKILNCTRAYEAYGRVFLYSNPNLPNFYWVMGISDKNDCSYFPQKYEYGITKSTKPLTSLKSHFGLLIGWTEDVIFKVDESTLDNQASFPIKYIDDTNGCDCPGTMQLINNNPVWCSSSGGPKMLVSSLIQGEKNVKSLGLNINGDYERPGLLNEPGLKDAISFDADGKYGIVLPSGKAYVWEYEKGYNLNDPKSMKWFPWDNVKASCFFTSDNTLMYGHSERGQLCKFIPALNDFGQPIKSVFRTKLMDFGVPDYEKNVTDIWLTTRANSNSALTIKYFDDNGEVLDVTTVPQTATKSFNWSKFSWASFTWRVQRFAPTIHKKPKLKKIRYVQFEFSNNNFNQNLSIISLVIKYSLTRKVR